MDPDQIPGRMTYVGQLLDSQTILPISQMFNLKMKWKFHRVENFRTRLHVELLRQLSDDGVDFIAHLRTAAGL